MTVLAACNKQKESQGVAQFTATIEHHGGRTSLDPNNGQINWTAGDQIVIGNDNGETAVFTLQSGEGTTEGGFGTTGEFNTVGPFVAAYPSDAIIENDKVTYNLPATQAIGETGTFANGANPMVAYSDNKNLQFKNLCGGLGIRLKGVGAHVSAVRITSKNTSEKLWGAYEVSNCASNEPMLTEASGNQGSNVITLSCEVTLTTAAKTFFVMLPPGTLANGFEMEVLDGDEVLASKETNSDIAIVERNNVKCFNEILIDVEFDGNVEIPTGMSNTDIIVTNLGEDAMPDENGDFFIGYSKMLTAKNATNNEIIYMSVLSVDYDIAKGENQLQSYVLNAKETALYYALTMIPFGLNQAKDETFQSIKNVLYDLDCVQALENAIEQSVNQNGYLRAEDIGEELNAVWNYLEAELLAPFLEMQSLNSGSNLGHIVLKKDGTSRLEQPQIQNNGKYRGIRLDIESANFNESTNTWTLNLTGYSDNGVFIGMNKGSIVDGQAYPTGGRTPYFIPPMNVGKFMGTFTSLGGLKDYFVDTWHLFFEEGFGFDDMTWDKAKLHDISFELGSNENALLMYSPKDDRPTAAVNVVYAIMQPVGIALDAILTQRGYSEFFTSLFADQELCATVAGVVGHPENFTTAAIALLSWAADLFATEAFRQYINPKYNVDKILEKIVSSSARAAIEYVGNGLGTLASWYLFDSFAFTVEAEYNNEPVVLPALTTDSYEVLSSTQATVTGTLVNAGTYDIVERGICYGTSHNPTLNDFYVAAEGTGAGAFTCTLDLQPNIVYYARAYAKNWLEMVGYSSNEVSFATSGGSQTFTITATANPANGGTVTGGGTYDQGQSCTVTTTANSGYTFTNWTENGNVVSTDASYTFTVSSNRTLVANYTTSSGPQTFTITTMTYPVNSGLTSGDGTYDQGQSCTVTATAISGYTFICWMENGDVVSTEASYTFTVNSNRTLVANFTANGGGGGSHNGHDYVDLGLPSGTLWATCNVGASTPEGYGDYFAWGETSLKSIYNWYTYLYCMDGYGTLTKYCNDPGYGYNNFTDNLTTLEPSDDAATANWGNGWRVPTDEEWNELCQNTSNSWTTQNGVNGRLFTSSNGNSLFLPAAGSRYEYGSLYTGERGHYWSNSLYINDALNAWMLYFNSGSCYVVGFKFNNRYLGHTVRAVRNLQ